MSCWERLGSEEAGSVVLGGSDVEVMVTSMTFPMQMMVPRLVRPLEE
jgi:hypothetical protein